MSIPSEDEPVSPTPRWTSVSFLVLTVTIVVCTWSPQLGAPLELQDDHRIIAPRSSGALGAWLSALREDAVSVGRFRPVSQVFDVVGPVILGDDARVWHGVLLTIAALAAALLFTAGWMLWREPVAAVTLALVTILAPDPGPAAAWYRLGPKEAWSTLLLSSTLVLFVRQARRNSRALETGSFVLVALIAFSKEASLLLLPALFGVRVWLEVRTAGVATSVAVNRLRNVAVAYAALFAGGIVAIMTALGNAGAQSYGGQSLGWSSAALMEVLIRDLSRAPSLAIWFVPVLLAFAASRHWRPRVDILAGVVFLAWVGPQYLLHATRGGLWDHYWLPCVVAFAAVNAGAFAVLKTERTWLTPLAAIVFVIWLINAVRIDVASVRNFVVRARVQQAAVRLTAEHLGPESSFLIVADRPSQDELTSSFVRFVAAARRPFRTAYLLDSRCTAQACPVLDFRSNEILAAVNPEEIAVVVHLDPRADHRFGAWSGRAGLQPRIVGGHQEYFSLRELAVVRIPFEIRVFTRARRGGT